MQKGLSPREYGQRNIAELQQHLLKDDQYIPGLKNEDPLDLARTAKVSATSVKTCDFFGKGDCNLRPGPSVKRDRAAHDLAHHDRATWFARGPLDRLEAVECLMRVEATAPVPLTMRVWAADCPTNGPTGGELLATWRGTAPVRRQVFVRFTGEGAVTLTKPYVWLEIGKTPGVSWLVRNRVIGPEDGRAWRTGKEWTIVKGEQYAFVATPQVRHRVHRFEACRLTAVRVTVTETWGDPSARICEIRVY